MFLPAPRFTARTGIWIADVKQGSVTASGSATIDMPSNRADTFVLAFMSGADDSTNIGPTLTGFTTRINPTGTADEPRFSIQYLTNPGTTAILAPQSSTRNAAYIIYSLQGVDLASPFSASSGITRTDSPGVPNPLSKSVADDDAFCIVLGSILDTTTDTGWSAPSGYSGLLTQSAGDTASQNVVVMSAYKQLGAAGTEDPGAFSHASVTGGWGSATVPLKPA